MNLPDLFLLNEFQIYSYQMSSMMKVREEIEFSKPRTSTWPPFEPKRQILGHILNLFHLLIINKLYQSTRLQMWRKDSLPTLCFCMKIYQTWEYFEEKAYLRIEEKEKVPNMFHDGRAQDNSLCPTFASPASLPCVSSTTSNSI